MTFKERLQATTGKQNSLVCIGLDPDYDRLPGFLKGQPDAVYRFCYEIIAATSHIAAAYKLNFAFFETYGSDGWKALENLRQAIPAHILTIADAKRADIGNTSKQYAEAILQRLAFDAITISPYMGLDSVKPFLTWPDKGAFILALTSNPGSRDFQYLHCENKPLYQHVIEKVIAWNRNDNCGMVVGATHPGQIAEIRRLAEPLPFLIPGIGTQGGSLEEAVRDGTDAQGGLALINSSRGIIFKSSGEDYAKMAALAAEELNEEINRLREQKLKTG